VTRS